jgi:hypothetical protein
VAEKPGGAGENEPDRRLAASVAAKLKHAGFAYGGKVGLAAKVGTTPAQVSRWLGAVTAPSLYFAVQLCKHFDWSIFYLLDPDVPPLDRPPPWERREPPRDDEEDFLLKKARELGQVRRGEPTVGPALRLVLDAIDAAHEQARRRRAVDTPLAAEQAEPGRPRVGPAPAPDPALSPKAAPRPGRRRRRK